MTCDHSVTPKERPRIDLRKVYQGYTTEAHNLYAKHACTDLDFPRHSRTDFSHTSGTQRICFHPRLPLVQPSLWSVLTPACQTDVRAALMTPQQTRELLRNYLSFYEFLNRRVCACMCVGAKQQAVGSTARDNTHNVHLHEESTCCI